MMCKGYGLMMGYYNKPKETADSYDEEGWFHTGDTGIRRADGYIRFLGRYKDMLKVGGENVAAAEVETYLAGHPAVKLAQVTGVPDDRLQEVVAAFVEKHDDQEVTEEELIAFCKGKIASYKVPRYVRFVTEWPMSTSKIQKFRLRDQIMSELGLSE